MRAGQSLAHSLMHSAKKDAFSVSMVAWKGENIYLPSCGRADSKNNVPSQLGWQGEKRRSVHQN